MSKLAKRQAVISDEQIVELYWQREESAIEETEDTVGFFSESLITSCMTAPTQRNVGMTLTSTSGMRFRRQDLPHFPHS